MAQTKKKVVKATPKKKVVKKPVKTQVKKKVTKKPVRKNLIKVKPDKVPAKIQVRKPEVFEKLKALVESGQTFGVTNKQLSEKLNVKRQTIGDYLKIIYSEIPDEDITHIKVKIKSMFERLFRESNNMIVKAKTQREKKEAMDLLLRCMDRFVDFLERFGMKEKVADRVDVRSVNLQLDLTQVSQEVLNQIK